MKNSNEYKIFENKSITKNHGMQSKCIEYKMFELKYGNTCNVSNVCIGYKYARSVLAVFASTYL